MILSCKKTSQNAYSIITDNDGNVYKTVKIGNQEWMAENLDMTKFNDGTENQYWIQSKYGKLYYPKALYPNYGKFCPIGWRVPLIYDWDELFTYLGGDLKSIGGKLKKAGLSNWSSATSNNIGFNAMPNGVAVWEGNLLKIINENSITSFWGLDTTDKSNIDFYAYTLLENSDEIIISKNFDQIRINNFGSIDLSCRCIKNINR